MSIAKDVTIGGLTAVLLTAQVAALLEGHHAHPPHAPAPAFANVNVGSTWATGTFRAQPAMPVEILTDTVTQYAVPVALVMSEDELRRLLAR